MRQDGYYWVKINGCWTVAEYVRAPKPGRWWLTGSELERVEKDFEEICERPIPKYNNIAYGESGGKSLSEMLPEEVRNTYENRESEQDFELRKMINAHETEKVVKSILG